MAEAQYLEFQACASYSTYAVNIALIPGCKVSSKATSSSHTRPWVFMPSLLTTKSLGVATLLQAKYCPCVSLGADAAYTRVLLPSSAVLPMAVLTRLKITFCNRLTSRAKPVLHRPGSTALIITGTSPLGPGGSNCARLRTTRTCNSFETLYRSSLFRLSSFANASNIAGSCRSLNFAFLAR